MATLTVAAGGSIQAAIDAAAPGDTIDVRRALRHAVPHHRPRALTIEAIGSAGHPARHQRPPNGKAMIDDRR